MQLGLKTQGWCTNLERRQRTLRDYPEKTKEEK